MIRIFILASMIALAFPNSAYAQNAVVNTIPETFAVPNEYVIKYRDGSAPQDLAADVARRDDLRSSFFGRLSLLQENIGNSLSGRQSPEDALALFDSVESDIGVVDETTIQNLDNTFVLKTDGRTDLSTTLTSYQYLNIEYIEPVAIANFHAIPNDSAYNRLWGMERIEGPNAWNISTGSSQVEIAILDSGIQRSHPDLSANVRTMQRLGDACTSDDPIGHGTHVSGTVAGIGNNGAGVAGVNWTASMHGYCLASSVGLKSTDIATAIQDAQAKGVKVMNMSFGGPGVNLTVKQAIEAASDITFVASAGNCGQFGPNSGTSPCIFGGSTENYWPAQYGDELDNLVVVAATGPNNEHSSYSSYGSSVAVSAPGGNPSAGSSSCQSNSSDCIYSTYPNNTYRNLAGTSMSAPHVTGLVALMYSVNPSLTPQEIKTTLSSTATDLGPSGWDNEFGFGIVNAEAALQAAGGTSQPTATPTTIQPPTTTPTGIIIDTQPTVTPIVTQQPTTTPIPTTTNCDNQAQQGDFNCDGATDKQDLNDWTDAFGQSTTTLSPFFEVIRRVLFN